MTRDDIPELGGAPGGAVIEIRCSRFSDTGASSGSAQRRVLAPVRWRWFGDSVMALPPPCRPGQHLNDVLPGAGMVIKADFTEGTGLVSQFQDEKPRQAEPVNTSVIIKGKNLEMQIGIPASSCVSGVPSSATWRMPCFQWWARRGQPALGQGVTGQQITGSALQHVLRLYDHFNVGEYSSSLTRRPESW